MKEKQKSIRLAIIDDEEDFLSLTKIFLEKMNKNYDLKLFDSPQKFLEYFEHLQMNKPDVIISDYELPGMNGLNLLSKLREEKSTIPFIMVTGKGREEIILEALNNGVEFYLQKSIKAESMYKELNYFIEKAIEKSTMKSDFDELKNIYQLLVDLTPEGIMIHSNRVIQFVNPALVKMLSYNSEKDLIGQPVFQIIHPNYYKFLKNHMKKIENGAITPFVRVQLLKSDGSPFDIEGTGRTIQYNHERAIIVFIRALTEYVEFD